MYKEPLKILLMTTFIVFFLSGCTRYQSTNTLILEDLQVSYEEVEEIKNFPKAEGLYSFKEDKIYIKKGIRQKNYIMLHELIHKIRNEVALNDKTLEEIICTKSAYEIGKTLGLQLKMSKFDLPTVINNTLKANGLKPRLLFKKDKLIVDREIEKTKSLLVDRLKEKGRSIKEIDWVRTAILLLL